MENLRSSRLLSLARWAPIVAVLLLAAAALWERTIVDAATRRDSTSSVERARTPKPSVAETNHNSATDFTRPPEDGAAPNATHRADSRTLAEARWQLRWRGTFQLPPSSERTAQLTSLVEAIAAESPELALVWIADEPASETRTALAVAVATGWATRDARLALEHFLSRSDLPRDLAVAAVLRGARDRPEVASGLTRELRARHPDHAGEFTLYVIGAYASADAHTASLQFIATLPASERPASLAFAFQRWAQQDPESALLRAVQFEAPDERRAAFEAAVRGWARVDPAALTRHAAGFPTGTDRDFALQTALRAWAEKDSSAAAEWIAQNGDVKVTPLVLED